MKLKIYLICLIAVVCVGCATGKVWVNDRVTQEQANRDGYECSYNAELLCNYWHKDTSVVSGIICVKYNYGKCLRARGYREVERPPDRR